VSHARWCRPLAPPLLLVSVVLTGSAMAADPGTIDLKVAALRASCEPEAARVPGRCFLTGGRAASATVEAESRSGIPGSVAPVRSAPSATARVKITGLPADAAGRAFAVNRPDGSGAIGMVGRITLDEVRPDDILIGLGGSVAVTASRAMGTTTVRYLDLATSGTPAVHSSRVPISVAIPVNGSVFLAANDPDQPSVDLGVSRWTAGSSAVDVVLKPTDRLTGASIRSLLAAADGSVVVSPLIRVGRDSSVATVIDGASGTSLGTVDLDGEPTSMTSDTLLVRTARGLQGVDVQTGAVRWTLDGRFGLGYARSASFVVTDELVRPHPVFRLLTIDARTGTPTVRFTHAYDAHWTLWPELSTETAAVVSPDGWFPEAGWDGGLRTATAVRLDSSNSTQTVGVELP
jgi:hypothetical protein